MLRKIQLALGSRGIANATRVPRIATPRGFGAAYCPFPGTCSESIHLRNLTIGAGYLVLLCFPLITKGRGRLGDLDLFLQSPTAERVHMIEVMYVGNITAVCSEFGNGSEVHLFNEGSCAKFRVPQRIWELQEFLEESAASLLHGAEVKIQGFAAI